MVDNVAVVENKSAEFQNLAETGVIARPRQFGAFNWIGLKTLYKREVSRFLKVGMQTLLAPVVSALLFMAIFKLAFPDRGDVGGVPFGDFIAPGIIMMAIMNNAFQNTSSSITIAKVQGNTTDFLMAPLSSLELALGFLAGGASRGLLVGGVTLVCIGLLGVADISLHSIPAFLFYSVTASFMMAAIGLLGGIWAEKFDHLAAVTNFVILPLTMLSGTFYPITVFSEPFETMSHFNPFFHLIDGFRYAFTGSSDGSLMVGIVASLVLAVVLCGVCWAVLRSGYKMKA
ncbi:ABC transporter permease [Hirschia baltica]|uniref:Transport permease protein n=1 Tax=Hirschia baltica (strain ATCC 49814 / DSM 5838 / IFAM 1418) TaxID=582402 RepID=C6XMA1_HIRBI|nr:ABC transporter permease [Hirschia baltica]ACT58044.1 ABC-2 type transporter [Hirschia baltica ATCC 49814]